MTSKETMTIGESLIEIEKVLADPGLGQESKRSLYRLHATLYRLQAKNTEKVRRHRENSVPVTALSLDTNSNVISLVKEESTHLKYLHQLEKDFEQITDHKYQHQGERDGKAINLLIKWSKGDLQDCSNRWRLGLIYPDRYYRVSEIHELIEKGRWNRFAGAENSTINGAM